MKIPKELPFWAILRHYDVDGMKCAGERLFFICEYEKEQPYQYWGHLVATRQLYHEENPYSLYLEYPSGNYGFSRTAIENGREPTEAQIEYGKQIMKKWEEKRLIQDI